MVSNLKELWKRLVSPRSADEDEARREYIVNVILVGASAISFVYTAVTAIAYSTVTGVPFPVLLAGLLEPVVENWPEPSVLTLQPFSSV